MIGSSVLKIKEIDLSKIKKEVKFISLTSNNYIISICEDIN